MSDNDLIRRGDADAAIILAIGSHKTPELRAARKALDALPAAAPTLADALALPEVRALVEAACRDDRPVAMKEFLHWIADRLVLHGDDENADFVLSLRERANRLDAALAAIKGGAA